jgi:hypothetical protein
MGQRLHGSARTTEAVRRAIPQHQQSIGVLAERHGITPKPVAQWQTRPFGRGAQGTDGWPVHDLNPGSRSDGCGVPPADAVASRGGFVCLSHAFRTEPARLYTAACKDLTSAVCRTRPVTHPRNRLSRRRVGTFTSPWPKGAPKRASCLCSAPSTAPARSPWPSDLTACPPRVPQTSCITGVPLGRRRSIRFCQLTAARSPIRPGLQTPARLAGTASATPTASPPGAPSPTPLDERAG